MILKCLRYGGRGRWRGINKDTQRRMRDSQLYTLHKLQERHNVMLNTKAALLMLVSTKQARSIRATSQMKVA